MNNHQHAQRYAQHGLRIIPIKPGTKHPPNRNWQNNATNNPDTINRWWNGIYPNHGIGLALGPQPNGYNLFALDLDNHGHGDGHTELANLEHIHGPLPTTWTAITGNGNTHLILQAPTNTTIRNQQASGNRIAPNIDVRGEGGQILIEPTTHPDTGKPYQWKPGHAPWDIEPAHAPQWLLNLVTEPTPEPTPTKTAPMPPPRNDDLFAAHRADWNWHHQLQQRGWTQTRQHGNDTYWARPGKNPRDGHSAILHGTDGPLVIFTTEIDPAWTHAGTRTTDGSGWSFGPFGFYAATEHHGDRSAAARALNQHYNPTPTHTTTTPDITVGDDAETPTELAHLINWDQFWTQTHLDEDWIAWPLIPRGRTVALYAPAKAGKSTIVLSVIAAACTGQQPLNNNETPQTPASILYLDYEMTAADLHERLTALGYGPQHNLEHLHYALLPSFPPLDTPEGAQHLVRLALKLQVDAVIVDTFGRAVAGDENDADTVRNFYRCTGQALKQRGIAVLRTDHSGKDPDKGQRGSSAKNDDVDVVYKLTRTNNGITLTRTHSRITWAPDNIPIDYTETEDGVHLNITPRKQYPNGTAPLADLLDQLNIPITDSTRSIEKQLRDNGHRYRSSLIRAACQMRRERHLDPWADEPTNLGKTLGKTLGISRDARRDAPHNDQTGHDTGRTGTHPTKPLVDDRTRSGTHPDAVEESKRDAVRPPIGDAPSPRTDPDNPHSMF